MIKNPQDYIFYNKEAGERFAQLSRDGLIAVYLYSCKVLKNGASEDIVKGEKEYRIVAFSGVSYAPAEFFGKHLSAQVEFTDGVKVTLGEKSITVSPISSRGITFLPLVETLKGLGLSVKSYCEDKLTVIARESRLAEIDASADMQEAGGYIVMGEYSPEKFTSDDFKAARQKWKKVLVGSETLNDLSDSVIAEKIGALSASAEKLWSELNKCSDRIILWGDKAPVESDQLGIQYNRIVTLAKAWGSFGSRLYKNEALKKDILDCVQWMYEHMYGEAEIAGKGWRDAHLFNWWYWYIAAPEALTDIFFIMEDEITLEQRKNYLKCFEWCQTFMRNTLTREMALSRICICTKTAIALEDPKTLYEEYLDLDMLLRLGTTEEGPRIDYVQWTHGMPYNTAYGKLNLDRVLFAAANLVGTPVEFTNPRLYNLFSIVKYMFEPAMYKSQAFMMFNGRSVHINESGHGTVILADMLYMIGMFGEDEDNYLKKLIKRNADTDETRTKLKLCANTAHVGIVKDIFADESIDGRNTYEYAHAWYTGDRAVQHRNDYAFGIALSSKREPPYESINSANKTGWYTGDGSHYLYTNYDRHCFDGNNFIMNNINIAYRFPGTTEDSRQRVIRSIASRYSVCAPNDFAGSMQIGDKYIVAGMDFISHHYDGPDIQPDDYGYGGSLPVHLNDLKAKKAWFCFDGEIICLGAAITSNMDSPVRTTLDHRRIVNDDKYSQFIKAEGKITELEKSSYEKDFVSAEWVLMEGHAGYYFPYGAKAHVARYICNEADGQQYFEIRAEHGKNPQNESYAYVVLPYATKEKLEEYSALSNVEILSNTESVQAVRDNKLGITGYVFYERGKFGDIETDEALIISVTEKDGGVTVSVSDPTHQLERAKIVFNRLLTPVKYSEKLSVTSEEGKTVIDADFRESYGRKYEVTLI